MYHPRLLLGLCGPVLLLVDGAPSPTAVLADPAIHDPTIDMGDTFEPMIRRRFDSSDEIHSVGDDIPPSLSKRDNAIPASDPSLKVDPKVETGTITQAQLDIWLAEGSTAKRDLGVASTQLDTLVPPPKRDLGVASARLDAHVPPPKMEPEIRERQTDIPTTAETTRIFGNQHLKTAKNTIIPGPFKKIETWSAANTLHGMRVTDHTGVVTVAGTINDRSDTYKYFVFADGEIITALRIWAAGSGGYERFTGFDFTTNLDNRFLCSFQSKPTNDIAVPRNAGGGFIFAIHTSVASGSIYNLGIDMVAPVSKVEYDVMDFTDFVDGQVTLSGGHIVTAGRLTMDNRNTTLEQQSLLRLTATNTYSRAISSSWMNLEQTEQSFSVTVTAGLPVIAGSSLAGTAGTAHMEQSQHGEEKTVTKSTAIEQGNWGYILCPPGRVCRIEATLIRWDAFKFDFISTMKMTTTTGAVWTWKNKGVYTGTDYADWQIKLGEYTVVD